MKQPLRDYIRHNITHLRSSPCLVISSSAPPAISTAVAGTKTSKTSVSSSNELKLQRQQNETRVQSFVERNVQCLALEFNLRTVPCHISSAFPTLSSVTEAVSLAKRAGLKEGGGSGCGVIVGIGSGAAIDLAKAVADTLFGNTSICNNSGDDSNVDNDPESSASLILAPCTLGGVWSATSNSPSILLDTKEEMLLPHLPPTWMTQSSTSMPGRMRHGTIVSLELSTLAMPPLYTPFQPVRRSEYSSMPPMTHVAAAALVIILDVARMLAGKESDSVHYFRVMKEIQEVTSSFTAVLELATCVNMDIGENEQNDSNRTMLAQHHLLNAIPRLSHIIELSSLLTNVPITINGTLSQKLANSLLPTHFPQCHLITFLASTLPGMCDVLSESPASDKNGSMLDLVTTSILERGKSNNDDDDAARTTSSLLSWATRVSMETGLPSMASLAFGTPDVNTLVEKLDSYEALTASLSGGSIMYGKAQRDDQWVMEDVLRRSLLR